LIAFWAYTYNSVSPTVIFPFEPELVGCSINAGEFFSGLIPFSRVSATPGNLLEFGIHAGNAGNWFCWKSLSKLMQ